MCMVEPAEKLHATASRSERSIICWQCHGLAASGNARIPALDKAQRSIWAVELCHCARPDDAHHTRQESCLRADGETSQQVFGTAQHEIWNRDVSLAVFGDRVVQD